MTEIYECDGCGKTMRTVAMKVIDQTDLRKADLCQWCAERFQAHVDTWESWRGDDGSN